MICRSLNEFLISLPKEQQYFFSEHPSQLKTTYRKYKITTRLKELIFFISVVIFFMPGVVTLQKAFLNGDYFTQFLPYMKVYSFCIKHHMLPWASNLFRGFSLVGEGQTGVFYPINIIMFYLLPFKVAYNYMFIVHFIISISGCYYFAKEIGASKKGAMLGSFVFCFGAAFGGCFYNVVTLRTLCWFGWILYFIERFFYLKKKQYMIFAGICMGLSFLAGFIQLACYSFAFSMVYICIGFCTRGKFSLINYCSVLLFLLWTGAIGYVQIAASYYTALYSTRIGQSIDFALWHSWNPVALLSLFIPAPFNAFTQCCYIGAGSLLFILCAFKKYYLPVILLTFISLACAFGQYNPLFVKFLSLIKFYSFRNPQKFLFFTMFGLSIMTALGFTRFKSDKNKEKYHPLIIGVCSLYLCAVGALIVVIKFTRTSHFKQSIQLFVNKFVIGKSFHRYSAEYYSNKIDSIVAHMRHVFYIDNPYIVFSAIILIALILIMLFAKQKYIKSLVSMVIITEILVFSSYGSGFRGNIKPWSYLKPTHQKLLKILHQQKKPLYIYPYNIAEGKLPNWCLPNAHILYGLKSYASYSPLVSKVYYDHYKGCEIIDNSLGLKFPSRILMDLPCSSYLLINKQLCFPSMFTYIAEEDGVFLYRRNDL